MALVVCLFLGAFVAGLVSLFLRPVYHASARLLVEDQSATGGLLSAVAQLPGGLSSLVGGAPQTAAEIEMLKSRPVATSVVLPAGTDEVAPSVGLNLLVRVDDLARQSLWRTALRVVGGEGEPLGRLTVRVEDWSFPDDFDEALRLRVLAPDRVALSLDRWFDAAEAELSLAVRGAESEPLQYEKARLRLGVEEGSFEDLVGRSFRITIQPLQKTVDDFLEELEVKEQQRGSNVLRVSYPDADAERSAAVVNAVVGSYMAHNQHRLAKRAGRPVTFLEGEIDRLRDELAEAEEALAGFGSQAGAIVLPDSAARLVDRLAEIDLERARLELSATATAEFVARYDSGEFSLRELAGLEEVLLAEAPPAEPLSALLAQQRGLEALYNEEWPELVEARAVVEERVAALRAMLSSRVTSEERLSQDLDQIQSRYLAELEGLPQAQVELLRYTRKVEAFSQIYLFLVGQLQEAKIREATAVPAIDVIERAQPPRKRSHPKLLVNLVLGSVLGLVVGVMWAFSRELRRPLSSPEQAGQAAAAPVLARVPSSRSLARQPLVLSDGSAERAAAGRAYQELRAALLASVSKSGETPGPRSLAVVSARRGEGRSSVAANLALALARTGASTLLVDADESNPVQDAWFEVDGQVALAAMADGAEPTRLATSEPTLTLVSGSDVDFRFADWSAGARGREAWERLLSEHEWSVLDTHALCASALAPTLASLCDGVVLVARTGTTAEDELQRAAFQLQQFGARVLGVVLL